MRNERERKLMHSQRKLFIHNSRKSIYQEHPLHVLSYFFVKKISLSRRVGYVMDGWFSERCMYLTSIILDLLLNTNQISCCKCKWYVRRFDPDTVQNGHIYSFIREEDVFIYWAYFDVFCGLHRGFCGRV